MYSVAIAAVTAVTRGTRATAIAARTPRASGTSILNQEEDSARPGASADYTYSTATASTTIAAIPAVVTGSDGVQTTHP